MSSDFKDNKYIKNSMIMYIILLMINFDEYTNESKRQHNRKWPYIPDHPYRILIIGGSRSGKTIDYQI